ncbi:MAG: M10 family metallopeptidase C-terminal domain-containing protein, partial [Candidatus Zixiibacteriota bacterium]
MVDLSEGLAEDGSGGVDRLVGIENVVGTTSDDIIVGDDGNNHIEGHFGTDTLTGGGGEDTFRFDFTSGADVITDFESGEDQII